jgi:hypothetical protein
MGNRYPSPNISRAGAERNSVPSAAGGSMKHAGSEGSLSSLNNLGNFAFNGAPKNQ